MLASRPQYLGASVAPVLVGAALGYAVAGSFHLGFFVLATLAIMALHGGANVVNDYFDSLSRNDWVNENPTPFSGGRQFIQKGILSPKATLLTGLGYLAVGAGIGLVIVALSRSLFILGIGVAGVLGAFFYTAGPFRLGYRGVGEIVIGFLFGILPVYGSYYLQARSIDLLPLLPALIVAILIFLVILVNEFPDLPADRQVDKTNHDRRPRHPGLRPDLPRGAGRQLRRRGHHAPARNATFFGGPFLPPDAAVRHLRHAGRQSAGPGHPRPVPGQPTHHPPAQRRQPDCSRRPADPRFHLLSS